MALLPPRKPLAIMRSVVFAMVLRELQVRFSSQRMGGVWTLLEPILHLVAYMLIYAGIRASGMIAGMSLSVFLLLGIVPFLLLRNISFNMMDALEANRSLFAYRQVQIIDAWVARVVVNLGISCCVLLLVGFVMAFWGEQDLRVRMPLQWALTWLIGLALAFGLGMVYCALAEVMPESRTIIRVVYLPIYLVSGVIFPLTHVPAAVVDWLALNPYLHVMEYLKHYVAPTYQALPQTNLAYPAAWAVVTLFIGFGLYRARRVQMMAV